MNVGIEIARAFAEIQTEELETAARERYRKALAAAQALPSGPNDAHATAVMDEYEAAAEALRAFREAPDA